MSKSSKNVVGTSILIIFGLLVVALIIGISSDDVQRSVQEDAIGDTARIMGRKFVEDSLRSPSSASFSNLSQTGFMRRDDGLYETWGWVDAQNAFGAQIRNDYRVIMERKGENWYRKYMQLGDRVLGLEQA